MWFELLVLIIGLIYGYVKPGKEDRMALLKKGIIIGIILGVVFGLIGFFAGSYLAGVGGGLVLFAAGAIGIFISVVILVILFIIGTFIGDFLETKFKKK
jgi:protein-S-isoprenylcysteine O-methyltransferase Ste14